MLNNYLLTHKEYTLAEPSYTPTSTFKVKVGENEINLPEGDEWQTKFNQLAETLQLSGGDLYDEILDSYEAGFKKPLSEFVGESLNDIDSGHGAW